MPPFEPPGLTRAKNKAWTKIAKADFRDPDVLWTDYWARFNTMSIPLLDEDAFFADAMAAARVAENREHLEQILDQKSRDRRAELADIVSSIAVAAVSLRTPFPTPASRSAALKVGQTGSLDSFVQLACGVAFSSNDAHPKMRKPRVDSRGSRERNLDEAALRNRDRTHQDACKHTSDDAHEEIYNDSLHNIREDGPDDACEETSNHLLYNTLEDASDDAYEEPFDHSPQDTYTPTGDPWEVENAFPPDLYDVHHVTAEDEYDSRLYDCDLERVAEIPDGEANGLPSAHTYVHGAGRSSAKPSQTCLSTPFSTLPKHDQVDQVPSSPASNGLSVSGTGSIPSEPPSPITPRTSFGFAEARISDELTTSLHRESPTMPEGGLDSNPHAESACKTLHTARTRKRSLSLDDGIRGDDNRQRKRRAVG